MKMARNVFFGLVVAGTVAFLSSVSFAQTAPAAGKDASKWKAKHEARMQLLKDSASVLQSTHPDLAKKLSDLVNGEGGKGKSAAATADWKAKHEARVKLYKDAAAALQQTHPDLAKRLNEMAEAKHKAKMSKANEEKDENKEKSEPKADK